MSLLKTNEIQVFSGTTVTITATTTEVSSDLNVGANLDVTGALTLGTALAVAEGGTGATDAATARTNLDVDQAGTDNSTDVTLVTTSHDYLSITGQAITLGPIDLAADVTGTLATSNGGTGATSLGSLNAADLGSGAASDGYILTADGAGGTAWEAASGVSLPIDLLSSGASIRKSDGTTAVLSESGGAVTLENVADVSLSGGIYFGTAGVTSGTGTETSNYLDDYEEGTFTASFYDSGLATSVGTATGYYVKVGTLVHISIYQNSSFPSSSPSGNLSIQNLPFLHSSNQRATGVIRSRKIGTGTMFRADIGGGSDQIIAYQDSSETLGSTSSLLYTNGGTSERVGLTICYQI